MKPKSKRAEDILDFLVQIKQTDEDIAYYRRLIEISEHTGRPINHQ